MATIELATGAKLGEYFTPSKPVTLPDLFEGRYDLLMRLKDAAAEPSRHVLIHGDRGVGKTSLARVLEAILKLSMGTEEAPLRSFTVSCDSTDSFSTIWAKVFRRVSILSPHAGLVPEQRQRVVGQLDQQSRMESPEDIRLLIAKLPGQCVFIFDEYDRVRNYNARRLMTDAIKLFSDCETPCTVVLVGVGQSIEELVTAHESISRNLDFVPVPPMTPFELARIVSNGFEKVGMLMEKGLDQKIATLSQGYPHYTHLLALEAGRKAIGRGSKKVESTDLREAIMVSLERVDGSIQRQYQLATDSTQPNNLYRQVLLACAMANKDPRGRFSFASLRQPLASLLERGENPGGFQRHLAAFCEPERGPALVKTGRTKNYRWHFADPQLIPYVYLQGIKEGLISDVDVGP